MAAEAKQMPRSGALAELRQISNPYQIREQLTNLAIRYSKHAGERTEQGTDVLVEQIMRQYTNGDSSTPIVFAIPFNPMFMMKHKIRDGVDGLDPAMRLALDNIAEFCYSIYKITGRRVVFSLIYDAFLCGGSPHSLLNVEDYLRGAEAIHTYTQRLNNDFLQIKVYDIVADYDVCRQSTEFQSLEQIEREHSERIVRLRSFAGDRLRDFYGNMISQFGVTVSTEEAEYKEERRWIDKNLDKFIGVEGLMQKLKSQNPSATEEQIREMVIDQITYDFVESTKLFKLMDERVRPAQLIRLSPHEKPASERTKFGFSFFPGTQNMAEPWMGNTTLCDLTLWEPQPVIICGKTSVRTLGQRLNAIRAGMEAMKEDRIELRAAIATLDRLVPILQSRKQQKSAEPEAKSFLQQLQWERAQAMRGATIPTGTHNA